MEQKPELYGGGPTHDELIAGGVRVEVEVLDHEKQHVTSREVTVRLVPVSEYPALRMALLEEHKLVPILIGNLGFAEELTPASHELVVDVGRRVNAHFFAHWLPRRAELEGALQSRALGEFMSAAAREFAAQMVGVSGATSSPVPLGGTAPSKNSDA